MGTNTFLRRKLFFGIQVNELLAVFFFYLFFSILYHIVLWYTAYGFRNDGIWSWINLRDYWFSSGMQYVFFLIASTLIWFLGINLLRNKKTSYQIIAVLLLIPITVFLVREVRYKIIDELGLGRLREAGTAWDLYIPLLLFFIQFGFFFAYRYFKENQKKLIIEGELRQAALKSELAAIKAQLNPHFLYNVFNTINASVPPKMEETRKLIATLSDLFRYQLKASNEELVSLGEELDFVNKYLELEKARFEERLQIEVNVPKILWDEKIPPMLLQPFVENSVKHGISERLDGGKISISIRKEEGKLKFEIADTGKGIKDKTQLFGSGVGLTNTRLRLEKMYKSKMEVLDNEPSGLKIRFAI